MNNPFDFFDKIYCINLPECKNRWERVSKEFKKVGILNRVERIWTTPPDKNFKISSLRLPTMFGCGLSHLKSLFHAMHENVENVLIFEDDVVFVDDYKERLIVSINELPKEWDILFLGGNPRVKLNKTSSVLYQPTITSDHLNLFRGAFAYSISRAAMIQLCDFYFENIVQSKPSVAAWDGITSKITARNKSYAIVPYICTTTPCQSIIQGCFVDYKTSQDKEWKNAL